MVLKSLITEDVLTLNKKVNQDVMGFQGIENAWIGKGERNVEPFMGYVKLLSDRVVTTLRSIASMVYLTNSIPLNGSA